LDLDLVRLRFGRPLSDVLGTHFATFVLHGVMCGVLICHDYRYPELYREYKKLGVQFMFHSYNAGNMSGEKKAMMEAEIGADYWHLNPGTFDSLSVRLSEHFLYVCFLFCVVCFIL
jgi:hypothetical protein